MGRFRAARRYVALACLPAGLGVAGAWVAARSLSPRDTHWARLSEIGQAFGVISAIISAVALVAVSVSLRIQRRQARVAQLEAVLALRSQLLQFAIRQPRYLGIWGFDSSNRQRAREAAYCSMVFAYLKMAFTVDLLTELELRHYSRTAFAQPEVERFWDHARTVYLNDESTPKGQAFAQIMDGQFAEHRRATAAARQPGRPREWAVTGLALGVAALGIAAARRKNWRTRSRTRHS
jgi:hypothetical protein